MLKPTPHNNVVQFTSLVKYEPLLFPVKSPEFEILAKILGRDEARIVQHLEHLFFVHGALLVPNDRIQYHITPTAKYMKWLDKENKGKAEELHKKPKCLLEYMGGSERSLFRKLDRLRAKDRFKKGTQFDPQEIDFQNKLYFTVYENVDNRQNAYAESQLFWYRNEKELHDLYQLIKGQIKPKKKAHAPANNEVNKTNSELNLATPLAVPLATPLAVPLAGDKTKEKEPKNKITEELNFKPKQKTKNTAFFFSPEEKSSKASKEKPKAQNDNEVTISNSEKPSGLSSEYNTCQEGNSEKHSEVVITIHANSSHYDVYRYMFQFHHGVLPVHVDGTKKKLDHLRITFDTFYQNGFLGEQWDFYEFLDVMICEWTHIYRYYSEQWFYTNCDSDTPDPVAWGRLRGKEVLIWYAEIYLTGFHHSELEFQAKQKKRLFGVPPT